MSSLLYEMTKENEEEEGIQRSEVLTMWLEFGIKELELWLLVDRA